MNSLRRAAKFRRALREPALGRGRMRGAEQRGRINAERPELLRVRAGCEPPPFPMLYVDVKMRHLLSTPFTPPSITERLPRPSFISFISCSPALRPAPDEEALERAVLRDGKVQELIQNIAKRRSARRKRRGVSAGKAMSRS